MFCNWVGWFALDVRINCLACCTEIYAFGSMKNLGKIVGEHIILISKDVSINEMPKIGN